MRRVLAFVMSVTVLIPALVGIGGPVAAATDPGGVVISELMYHPAGDGSLEYIELFNRGTEPASLSGLFWGDGVTGSLPDVSIPPGGFVIVSPDPGATADTYGVTPIAAYTGKLSNGGEKLTLLDDTGALVDEVDYDDKDPWPVTPDGDGPALELIDLSFDNDAPTSWQASVDGGSPGEGPQVLAPGIADISIDPTQPASGQAATVAASIGEGDEATLVYMVGFGDEQRVAMTADNGRYSAEIPGEGAGTLVRYRIETADGLAHPSTSDSRRYEGYVVESVGLDTDLPRLQWFIEEHEFDEMVGGSLFDRDRLFPAVIALDGTVFDGAMVQVRGGNYSRFNHPKLSFNVEMPDGYLLDAPSLFSYPVDEFALQAEYNDASMARAHGAWYVFEDQGAIPVPSTFVHVERNGDFFGLYRLSEKLDGTWREQNGFGDFNFYKADGGWEKHPGFDPTGFDQKEGDPADPILDEVRDLLAQPFSSQKIELMYDQFDIPNIVNFMALAIVTQHVDQGPHNFYVGHDRAGTGRVSLYPWDLDLSWTLGVAPRCGESVMTDLSCLHDPLFDSFWDIAAIREAVNRRIRSILDGSLADQQVQIRHDNLIDAIGSEVEQLESAAWDRGTVTALQGWFNGHVQRVFDTLNEHPSVPGPQSATPRIVISEIHYKPAGDGPEILELANPGSQSVDLSGWTVDGVGLEIPYGTIIPAGGWVVLTDNDAQFQATHSGLGTVVVEYPGGLKGSGETISLLNDQGVEIDRLTYSGSAPWPTEPHDGLVSLELVDLGLDNSKPESWLPSTIVGGTPGSGPSGSSPVEDTAEVGVLANGTTGDEIIEIRNGDAVLASFQLSTSLDRYLVVVDGGRPEHLRVAFVNNGLSNGRDRNVRVDYVEVDGVRYETEDPNVTSTGTWNRNTGCQPGNKQSEILHCNGHFDYTNVAG